MPATQFDAKYVKNLFSRKLVFTKVIQAVDGDDQHLHFFLEQLANPKQIRPIKALLNKANRKRVRNLVTQKIENREVGEERGGPKETVFIKKTSLSKPPFDGVFTHFADETSVGMIFEHDNYNHPYHTEDRLVKLKRDQKSKKPKYVFLKNEVTNNKFWIEGQHDFEVKTNTYHLSEIEDQNSDDRYNGYTPAHNEILGSPSKASVRGIFVPKIEENGRKLVAPKLNALRVKYMVQSYLDINVPVLIVTPRTGVIEYHFKDQIKDIIAGLIANPAHNTFRVHFAREILDRSFLENDNLWTELHTQIKLTYFRDFHTDSRNHFRLLRAIMKIREDFQPLISHLQKIAKDSAEYNHAIQILIEYIHKNKLDSGFLTAFVKDKDISFEVLEQLCNERRFEALGYSLDTILKYNLLTSFNKHDLVSKLIQMQQYELALKIINSEEEDKVWQLNDPPSNNALHRLYTGPYPNIKPPTELVRKLAQSNSVNVENKDHQMPIELAIHRQDIPNVEYFLTNHFNQFSPKQLFRIMIKLCETQQFALLSKFYQKFILVGDVKTQFAKYIAEYHEPITGNTVAIQMLRQKNPSKKPDDNMLMEMAHLHAASYTYGYNKNEDNIVTIAIEQEKWEVVEFLLEKIHLNIYKEQVSWVLHELMRKGKIHLAKKFLNNCVAHNADLNSYKGVRFYPLHAALLMTPPDNVLIKRLCDTPSANFKLRGVNHKGIVTIAWETKNWEILNYLIDNHLSKLSEEDVINVLTEIMVFEPAMGRLEEYYRQAILCAVHIITKGPCFPGILEHCLTWAYEYSDKQTLLALLDLSSKGMLINNKKLLPNTICFVLKENHSLFETLSQLKKFLVGYSAETKATVSLQVCKNMIDYLKNPADIVTFIDDLFELEKNNPIIKASRRPITFNCWRNEKVSSEWIELINHARNQINNIVREHPEQCDDNLRANLRLFNGARTSTGLFSNSCPKEKIELDSIIKAYDMKLESPWEMVPACA